jgi:hypothetical protein
MFSSDDDNQGLVLGVVFGVIALVIALVIGIGIYTRNLATAAKAPRARRANGLRGGAGKSGHGEG